MDGPVGNTGYLSKGLGMSSGLTQMKGDTKSGNEDENQLRWHWQRKQDKTLFFSLRSKQVKKRIAHHVFEKDKRMLPFWNK